MFIKKIVFRYKEAYFCIMNRFLQKNYLALIQGGIIITGLTILVNNQITFFIIDPVYVSSFVYLLLNILGFISCWLLTAFLIHKFSIYKVLPVVGLLVAVIVADYLIEAHQNPISIPLLIIFWLSIASLVLPQFFKKYKIAILSVYGLVISYYFFDFMTTSNYSADNRLIFSNVMLAPIPVFAILWLYEQWRWLRMLKADKAKAELALLKNQINPHFFFNTLNNLYGLVVEQSEKAPEVILKLSDMMRYTIYDGKEEAVLLKDEVNYLKNYIDLHKIRYQKNVDISFTHDIDENLKVAPLLFIILLENAFKHGIEKMRTNAYIHLQMKSDEKQLLFTIENNFDKTADNQKPGIGLENLKKRLLYLYPNRHELRIEKTASTYKVGLNLELIILD